MQEEAGILEKKRLESAKKRAVSRINELERRIKEGDFTKKEKKPVVADSELIRLNAEKLRIQEKYDKEFFKAKLANRTRAEKIKDAAWEAWGLTRALQATGELSFVLIQGGTQTLSSLISKPSRVMRAFRNAWELGKSESKAEDWLRQIKSQDWYPQAKEAKLAITEPSAELTAREEAFFSGWSNWIWNLAGTPVRLLGKKAYDRWKQANLFKASERAAVGYLDTIRVERYLDGVEMLTIS